MDHNSTIVLSKSTLSQKKGKRSVRSHSNCSPEYLIFRTEEAFTCTKNESSAISRSLSVRNKVATASIPMSSCRGTGAMKANGRINSKPRPSAKSPLRKFFPLLPGIPRVLRASYDLLPNAFASNSTIATSQSQPSTFCGSCSFSLARRRNRPTQPKVPSSTYRLGYCRNPHLAFVCLTTFQTISA
jgi:hypothetical protein